MGKSVCSSSTSEKVSNYIPNDLAISILSKLPIKSLKRFGCVHKSWSLLLEDDPDFMSVYGNNLISKHHSYYDDTSLLIHRTPVGYLFLYHSEFHLLSNEKMFEDMLILDSSLLVQELGEEVCVSGICILGTSSINGIFALYDMYGNEKKIVLWNPATKEVMVIPPSPEESIPYRNFDGRLHGFGYDHVSDDYRMIRHLIFYELEYNDYDIPLEDVSYDPLWEIYSLRSNSWRKLDIVVDMPVMIGKCGGGNEVYLDGMCHWWGYRQIEPFEISLASFKLSNEMFFTTQMPSDISSKSFNLPFLHRVQLMVLNGSIALIYGESDTFHISVLGEICVKESWTKLFVVGPLPCVERPIGAGKKGNIFFTLKNKELLCFDLSTRMIAGIGVKEEMNFGHIAIYKESLLPIGGINT